MTKRMRFIALVITLPILWFVAGLPAAGWFNAWLRVEYCTNYRDPLWAADNQLVFALGGPIATFLEFIHGDYVAGWTLSRKPTEHCP